MSSGDPAAAIAAAAGYLEAQRRNALWEGFPTLAGSSDAWVSGFVCTHLAAVGSPDIDAVLAETVTALLERRSTGGGWSYGAGVPDDADSTAWCAQATRGAAPEGVAEEVAAVLASHRVGHGYATYREDGGIAEFVDQPAEGVAGWSSAHPDVTAAVLLADEPEPGGSDERDVLRWLVGSLSGTGLMPSYWWRGELYGTALTLRALHARGRRLPENREAAMARGLERMQLADGGFGLGASSSGDAFTTAMGLEAWCRVSHLDDGQGGRRAAQALLDSQRPGGAWPGGFVLRIPAPGATDPRLVSSWSRATGGGNSYVPDVGGVFATTAAAYALDLWRRGAVAPQGQVVDVADGQREGGDEVVVPAPG